MLLPDSPSPLLTRELLYSAVSRARRSVVLCGPREMLDLAIATRESRDSGVASRLGILRFLQRRGVISLVTAPGDGEVTVVTDETMGEKDPLLAKLLAAATAGISPAGPASKRQPIRIVLAPDERPVGKGALCGQSHGFNLHGATRVAANDQQGRLALCKYILRPPLANAWGAGRLCRPRTIAGRFGNPLRVSILTTG